MRSLSVSLLVVVLWCGRARAERPEVPSFTAADYGLTLGLGALALGTDLWGPPDIARWQGGILMDDVVRDGLRADSERVRTVADDVSDGLVLSLKLMVGFDAVTMIGLGEPDDAWRMAMIDVQAYATAAALVSLAKNLVGRARPFVSACKEGEVHCTAPQARKSFLSGHTAMAFTAAGLICTHHRELDLFGGGTADAIACGMAIGAAGTAGILRIVADKHYSTDVIAGLAVGTFAGFILPVLLHYGDRADRYEGSRPGTRGFPFISAGGTF